MKIAVVIGNRPETIKMAPLIKEIQARGLPWILVHSNQHYSDSLDAVFFRELEIPPPHYNLMITHDQNGNQAGKIASSLREIFAEEKPHVVVSHGDANTSLAAVMAAKELGIKVAHIEAGLRSHDKSMPEETNRIVCDQLADILLTTTQHAESLLRQEGVDPKKIHCVGNLVVDSMAMVKDSAKALKAFQRYGLTEKKYLLLTIHRSINIRAVETLENILDRSVAIAKAMGAVIVWPMHPRVQALHSKTVEKYKATISAIEALPYAEFESLLQGSQGVLTDSGGVQEEACILNIPCITFRNSTERKETLDIGANMLISEGKVLDVDAVVKHLQPRTWMHPYGDKVAGRILKVLLNETAETKKLADDISNLRITMVGLGYMGLPSACLLANAGFAVAGFDINQKRVDLINSGQCTFDEPGMPELISSAVKKSGFKASTEIALSDIYIIAVPTPEKDHRCDLNYVIKAAESVSAVLKDGDIVILESTVKPNTCVSILGPILSKSGKKFALLHCPERAIPGNTLQELVNNDRIIGGNSVEAVSLVERVYSSFVKGRIYKTDLTTAECVKLMENSYRDVNIAFANELSNIGRELGINVWEAISLANRHPRVNILSPGPGVGGHCIAVDPWFLSEDSTNASLIPAARKVNDGRPMRVVEEVMNQLKRVNGKKVGVLGLAYKKNVDDVRESPAEIIYKELAKKGVELIAFDPFVTDWDHPLAKDFEDFVKHSDIAVLVTDHDAFKKIKFPIPVLDTRNCLSRVQFENESHLLSF